MINVPLPDACLDGFVASQQSITYDHANIKEAQCMGGF